MNEFSKKSNVRNKVPRSTHDLSFQNNLTLKFGAITPVFCREVLGGDSFRIKPTFGLRALPLVFPCQTRMRAYLHFFYVRNRTLWKDWMDFIFGTKSNLVPPYISPNTPVQYRSSSLADYLGLPVVRYNTEEQSSFSRNVSFRVFVNTLGTDGVPSSTSSGYIKQDSLTSVISGLYSSFPSFTIPTKVGERISLAQELKSDDVIYVSPICSYSKGSSIVIVSSSNRGVLYLSSDFTILGSVSTTSTGTTIPASSVPEGTVYLFFTTSNQYTVSSLTLESTPNNGFVSGVMLLLPSLTSVDIDELVSSQNPYRLGSNGLQPSALPFRAYEAIYNAYYRNQQVEPLLVDGQPEYNRYISNYDYGSVDSFPYELHYRNWEDDVFTTCLPSPQQGAAPMVGVTIKGNNQTTLAFSDADGNVYNATPVLNSDKSGISSFTITSSSSSSVIPVSAALNSGITINDFRNVNALQRYLELSQLRGYRYKDLMNAHLDVDIKYNELMMPEFIGGCSRDINVSQITATANTLVDGIETQVGDYKAQAGLVGQCGDITKYCDEHGFIIGLLTIVPVPVYGQQLQKFWFKRSQFDYFSPEFANIGLQSVSKKEIAPLNLPSDQLNKTFGYQRPWYEYLSALDQSHGLFNTSLRNFILNRSFGSDVNLTGEFLHVDPKQLNDIFSSTLENDDKFLGEVYFDVKVKTAVPSSVLPRLE